MDDDDERQQKQRQPLDQHAAGCVCCDEGLDQEPAPEGLCPEGLRLWRAVQAARAAMEDS